MDTVQVYPCVTLSIVDYMQYLAGHEHSRCVYEGEEVLQAGHLILCGQTNKAQESELHIFALCLQTSALTSNPHEITGVLAIQGNKANVRKMVCSCKAGSCGRCKHISATLLWCTKRCIYCKVLYLNVRMIFKFSFISFFLQCSCSFFWLLFSFFAETILLK